MIISKFINALKPKINKVDVLADIHSQQKELEETVLVSYKEFNSVFSNYKVKSDILVKVEKELRKRNNFKGNLFGEIESRLLTLRKVLDDIEGLIDTNFSDTVYKDAMNLAQANLMQLVTASSYVIRYARNLMTLGLIEEAEASGQGSNIRLVKVEHTRLENDAQKFVNTLINVTEKGKNAVSLISKIPNVFATEESVSAYSSNRAYVDPFGLNFLDSGFNPAYFVGMIIAEKQAANYLDAKEDFEAQQSLLLNLRLAMAKENDPKLEQKIQRQVERVQKIRKNLDDMERKYGLK